jgi:hypothetical protein
MERYGEHDRFDDDYDIRVGRGRDRDRDRDAGPKPHSGVGITSIFCAIFTLVGYFIVMAVAIAMAVGNNNAPVPENDPKVMAIGFGVLLAGCANFVGLVIGFIGCFQSDRNILCAVIGTVLNGILLLSFGLLILFGIIVGG